MEGFSYIAICQIAEGFGNEASSRMESAEGALPTRGKQYVSRHPAAGTYLFILLS